MSDPSATRRHPRAAWLPVLAAALLVCVPATARASGGELADQVAPVLLALGIILAGAKCGGSVAVRLGQPAVLGELVVGVLLGNLHLIGPSWFRFMATNTTLEVLAQLGAMLLLFEVGLESTVRDMLAIGWTSLLVAVVGTTTSFVLGWGASAALLPGASAYVHLFAGATLTATSVGITARVLKDLGQSQTPTARVILGAAVIDDVLGLVILAVICGIVAAVNRGTGLSYSGLGLIVGKSIVFLGGSLALGVILTPHLFRVTAHLRGSGVFLVTGLVFCFLLAYLAHLIGLAPIVGAYAAGLILEPASYRPFTDRGEQQLEELVRPVAAVLVPVFFVLMAMRVDLKSFARIDVLGLAAMLSLAAILGKQACSVAAAGRGLDRLSIGLGMVPRGEVSLIFANIGLGLSVHGAPIFDEGAFSAVVIMVLVTTMVTPPALKWSLGRQPGRPGLHEPTPPPR